MVKMMTKILEECEYFDVSEQSQKLLRVLSHTFASDMVLIRRGLYGWSVVAKSNESNSTSPFDGFEISGSENENSGFADAFPQLPGDINHMLEGLFSSSSGEPGLSRAFPIDQRTSFVATSSLGANGEFEIVGGFVPIDGTKLAERLLVTSVLSVQIDELQELHSQYSARLSSSFEELCFLRRLSGHIEYCVGNRPLSDMAQLVIGELRQILSVEYLCLIEASSDANSSHPRAGKFLAQDGQVPISEEFWRDALDEMSHNGCRTQVKNIKNSLHANGFRNTRQVRSFAITPLRKENQLFGWLLAVNKKVPHELSGVLLNSLGDDELGSMEASLLEVAARILGAHAANYQMFKSLEQLVVDVIRTLVNVVEAKDLYTSGHSNRVARIAHRLAEQLQIPSQDCTDIYTAGLLHDIGKIGVRDEVLNKPDTLTDAELEEIKQHPAIGARMLEQIKQLEKYLPGVLYHHESVDGSGYPCGLKGDQIPLMARVLAVADALDAMTSHRPYRQGMPIERAASILQAGAGQQWDATIVAAYVAAKDSIDPLCNSWVGSTADSGTDSMRSQAAVCLLPPPLLVIPGSSAMS